jgi:hypothetical protein
MVVILYHYYYNSTTLRTIPVAPPYPTPTGYTPGALYLDHRPSPPTRPFSPKKTHRSGIKNSNYQTLPLTNYKLSADLRSDPSGHTWAQLHNGSAEQEYTYAAASICVQSAVGKCVPAAAQ